MMSHNFSTSLLQAVLFSSSPDAGYQDRLGPSGVFVENSTQLTCLGIAGYQIKYYAVTWLLELQIMRGRQV
jgi:hypothetical protein